GQVLEDRAGVVWAMVTDTSSRWVLCKLQGTLAQCFGRDGGPGLWTLDLYEDTKGRLWTGTLDGVWRWQPGEPTFFPLPMQPNGYQGFAEDDDGTLLISFGNGIARLVDGRAEMTYPFPPSAPGRQVRSLLRDRDGGVWSSSSAHGLGHLHRGVVDVFGGAEGLSGDTAIALFEDREGSIWVATTEGLDRFRDAPVVPFSQKQGLSNDLVTSVLADADGSAWVATNDGLNHWKDGKVTVYRGRGLEGPLYSLFQDRSGRIWVSGSRGIAYLDRDRFVPVPDHPAGLVRGIAEDVRGNLWVAYTDQGRLGDGPGGDRTRVPWERLQHADPPNAFVADRSQPGVWVGFLEGGVALVTDDRVSASYSAAQGLARGPVRNLYF